VFDAYASEYVDGVLDVIIARKNEALRRTGQKLTKHRFSPGYGDLDISYQKVFYDLLDMQTLDVTINENYLLSPEKSVIAIAGVE
jgi:cobalamin-dependent methionine synthase I